MEPRPLVRALLWLLLLGPFFFLSYNFANAYASRLPVVPAIVFAWEQHVPFLAWTILPYWSSDLLYVLSLAICRTRAELDRHAWRLLAIQLFSVSCFLAFPLRLTYARPELDGWTGWLFGSLTSFDKAFNEAPSLHVSLAVILWTCYRRHLRGWFRRLAAAWFVLVALSAWTTYQHHFIDLPTGLGAGLLVLAAVPERRYTESRNGKLACGYLAVALALTVLAFSWQGWAWAALWPAFSFSMVACAYWTGDPVWLAKRNGRIAFWMWPFTICAWINSRLWTRGQEPWQHLADGVWIGRAPFRAGPFASVVDLTAEMPVRAERHVPVLDLTVPRADQMAAAVAAIEASPRPVLVCCALGYSRSATVAAVWLMRAGHAASVEDAVAKVRRVRPQIVMGKEAMRCVQACAPHAASV
jgi:hypothetical protein